MPALDFLVQRVYFRRAVLVVATLVAVGLYIDTRWNPDTTWSRVRDAQHSFELADRADSVHAASNKSSSDVQETPRVNDVCMDRVRPEQDLQLPPLDAPVVLYEWTMFEPPVILNQDVFGTVQQNPVRYLIVIRVHDRLRYLRALLSSLERVRGVESALLVLSHDVVDEELLEAARSVCYCRVLRVFFPYSRQIWPDQFPGPDDPGPSTAEERVGKSSQRNASFTMAKHHWWWMHNKVFTDVYSLTNFSGTTLFLEEDMIVSPDILHVLDVMQAKEKADIFVLNDNNGWLDSTRGNKAVLTHWVYNMGVALGPATWAKIVRCAEFFCSYDDYNHDWSLQALGARCVPGQLTVLVMTGSRVFHVGKCGGMHFGATSDCDALQRAVSATLDAAERAGVLFPETLSVTRSLARTVVSRPSGGWSDPRDHQLCMDVANASIVRWGSTPGTSTPSRSPRRITGKGPAA